jgi:hypothetical protein
MRDTIDLIREAGFKEHNGLIYVTTINDDCAKEIERLVALVRADERNRTWTQEHWTEYERSIAAQEREACAELVYNSPPSDEYESPLKAVYDAIRNRGNI